MLFVPPSMPYMAPAAEASSHTGDGVLCHVDISWTPNPPTAGQTVTFTGKLVEEVNGTCSSSNPPLAGKEVAPNLSAIVSGQTHQAYGSSGLPITNSAGVWTGAVTFDDDDDGNWQMIIFFGGDSTHANHSTHDQTGSFINFTVAVAPDTTPPVITGLQNIIMNTNSTSGIPVTFIINATDNVAVTSGPTCSPSSGSNFSVGTTTVTCTTSDAAGNPGTGSFTVTVNYTPPPSSDINLVGVWGYDVVYSVGDTLAITGTGATPGSTVSIGIWDDHRIFGFGIQYVTATSNGEFSLDWVIPADYCCIADTADPFSDGPKPVTQRFEDQHRILVDDGTTTDQGYFSIQDAADTTPQLTINSLEVWARDTGIWRFNAIGDAPLPTMVTVEFIRPDGVVSHESSFMNDDTYSHYNLSGYLYGLENLPTTQPTPVHYGTWTLKLCAPDYDMCVEQNSTVFSDPTPVLYTAYGLPTGIWLANNSTGYNVSFIIWASDQQTTNGDYTYEPATCSPASSSLFPIGNTTVTCTATDDSGNVGTLIFDVLVVLDDTTPAEPTAPTVTASAYLNDTSSTGRTLKLTSNVSTSDPDYLYVSILMPDYSFFMEAGSNTSVFRMYFSNQHPNWDRAYLPIPEDWVAGSYDIIKGWCYTCTENLTDVITVTVPALPSTDTTPPSQNYDVVASYDGGAWWQSDYFTPKLLTINTGDTVTWIHDPNSQGSYIRIYGTSLDHACGSIAQQAYPHPLVCIGTNSPVPVSGFTAPSSYTQTFTQPGIHTYTTHNVGSCQNLSNIDPTLCPIGIIVVADPTPTGDTTPPVVNILSNISLSTPDQSGRTTTFSVSASDNAGVSSGPVCSPSSGSQFPIGTTTVTCLAIDSAGNMGSGTFTVTVTYSATLPLVVASYAGGTWAQSDYFTPSTLTINVGDTVTWIYDPNSSQNYYRIYGSFDPSSVGHYIGDDYVTYDHTFNQIGTYVYTDHYRCQTYNPDPNTCPIGTIVVVAGGASPPTVDTTPPVITVPSDQNFSTTNSTGYSYHIFDLPTATDDSGTFPDVTCDSVITGSISTGQPTIDGWFPAGTTTITCTATDAVGNPATASFTVNVTYTGTEEAPEEAAEEIVIPSWIKSNAGWWDAGLIDNRNYVTGLQWLITNGIMTIPPTEQGTGSDDVIPSWVKNNARWWADGSIDDRNYVTGLQWLITNGVMTIG